MLNAFLFFTVAVVYATVGFGGGSGYIAILSFTDLPPASLRFIALCCNIAVVSGGTFLFIRKGVLSLSKALPFVLSSVPMAFVGGAIQLQTNTFFTLLAATLLTAGICMFLQPQDDFKPNSSSFYLNVFIGGSIGLISGLVGIGGGIFLAPILYLMKWDKAQAIAATSSFFILVNSVSALTGQIVTQTVNIDLPFLLPLLVAVVVGGQIGSRLNINWLSQLKVKRLTAILVIFASVRIFYKLFV